MLNSPVTTINARKRGTTRFLIGSTPSTCSASSSSRILRAPRSAVIAVPPTPAKMIAEAIGANSRIDANTKKPPKRSIAPNNTRKLPACRPRRAVAERDRRDHQRQPAEPQHEQKLLHELRPIRKRRPHRRHQRLARQNHHVPNLLQQGLRRQKDAISSATDQLAPPPEERPPRRSRRQKPMACVPRQPEGTAASMGGPERRSPAVPRAGGRLRGAPAGGMFARL